MSLFRVAMAGCEELLLLWEFWLFISTVSLWPWDEARFRGFNWLCLRSLLISLIFNLLILFSYSFSFNSLFSSSSLASLSLIFFSHFLISYLCFFSSSWICCSRSFFSYSSLSSSSLEACWFSSYWSTKPFLAFNCSMTDWYFLFSSLTC